MVFGAVTFVDSEASKAHGNDAVLRYYGHARLSPTRQDSVRWDSLPSHLQGEDPEKLTRVLYGQPTFWELDLAEIRSTWTRENWLEGYVGKGVRRR